MNICIIGGSGFIGRYVIDLLKEHHYILNIDKVESVAHKDIPYIECDIRNYEKLKASIPVETDCIILLAAEHKDDVTPTSLYFDVNVEGTRNVSKVMTQKDIKNIIFTSSVAVYGLNKQKPSELSPTDPFNEYGKSKLEAENVLKTWYDDDQNTRSLTIIRPTVIFGPGNRGNVYNLLSQISSGKFMMIGNGNNRKSMAYVENMAGFIVHCINSSLKNFHLFNYIDKPDLSTRELVTQSEIAIGKKILPVKIPYWFGYSTATLLDFLLNFIGKKNPISAVRVKKFCATTQFESVTIQSTGFQPPFTLQKGLEITIKSIMSDNSAPTGVVFSND